MNANVTSRPAYQALILGWLAIVAVAMMFIFAWTLSNEPSSGYERSVRGVLQQAHDIGYECRADGKTRVQCFEEFQARLNKPK